MRNKEIALKIQVGASGASYKEQPWREVRGMRLAFAKTTSLVHTVAVGKENANSSAIHAQLEVDDNAAISYDLLREKELLDRKFLTRLLRR